MVSGRAMGWRNERVLRATLAWLVGRCLREHRDGDIAMSQGRQNPGAAPGSLSVDVQRWDTEVPRKRGISKVPPLLDTINPRRASI